MKSVYEVHYDGHLLDLAAFPDIRENWKDHRIVWNYRGMRGLIPPPILEAQFELIDDYRAMHSRYDLMPQSIGILAWECVVRVPPRETPIGPPTDEGF